MNYLSATSLGKAYGLKVLFEDLTFGISKGQKVALVGRNGCGKSTLLRVLAGRESPDTGEVSIRTGVRHAFLDQHPDFGEAVTVLDAVFTGDDPRLKAISDYETLSKSAAPDPERLQAVMDRMDALKAWEYEVRIREVLGKLGIEVLSQPVAELSGGQVMRVALARALVQEPDLLFLDEPTNHLDTDTVEWLEGHLAGRNMSLVLVTHDRYFLDRVCNEIFELDGGQLYRYEGDYEHFLEKKAGRAQKEDTDTDRARNLLRKELEWLRRQPKARGTKSKAKVDMVHEHIEAAQGPARDKDIQLNFKARRLGKTILELDGVSKAWDGKPMVRDFSYVFKRGDRIGAVGPNGVGKTTFLNLLTGDLAPDSGTVEAGQTVVFGYYRQEGLQFREGAQVIDVITDVAERITMGTGETLEAASALTLFGFPRPVQRHFVSELSGGERRRLYLLKVLMSNPNFLILDEPTNDLDLITLNTLEQFLLAYTGCLVIVSHDRYFLDKLCEHLFVFEGDGRIKPFPGKFSEYRARKARQEKAQAEKKKEAAPEKKDTRVRQRDGKKLSYKEQKEYEALEKEIAELEEKKAELTEKINAGSGDYKDLEEWGNELQEIGQALEEKGDRWLELAERAEA